MIEPSLPLLCALLFVDGATLAVATTPLVLAWAPRFEPWQVGLAGGVASAAGSAVQLAAFRWMLAHERPWMRRFVPSRARVTATLSRYPSTSFAAIAIARATPLPDAPVKLVAAAAGYPIPRYFAAVLLGGAPYYFLLAWLGHEVRIPLWAILSLAAAAALALAWDLWRKRGRA